MAGNEREIVRYLFNNKEHLHLRHLGKVVSLSSPGRNGLVVINNITEIDSVITEDSRKKADIYVNGIGVSLKQKGGSFSFNRMQRANLLDVFNMLGFQNTQDILCGIDNQVGRFHAGLLDARNRPWDEMFSERYFKNLLKFLMMDGSPNQGFSQHPAQLIIECPTGYISPEYISVYTFDEYFEHYKDNLMIAIRRQWVGQDSNSEHTRAVGLSRKVENIPWVFNNVVGTPRSGWMANFPEENKKTVYFLMVEKT